MERGTVLGPHLELRISQRPGKSKRTSASRGKAKQAKSMLPSSQNDGLVERLGFSASRNQLTNAIFSRPKALANFPFLMPKLQLSPVNGFLWPVCPCLTNANWAFRQRLAVRKNKSCDNMCLGKFFH